MELLARYHDGLVADRPRRHLPPRWGRGHGAARHLRPRDPHRARRLARERRLPAPRPQERAPHRRHRQALRRAASPSRSSPTSSCARQMLPALAARHRQDRAKQLQLVGIATAALASVIVAYLFGVPLLAGNIVRVMPTEWEQQIGDTVATQLEEQLTRGGRLGDLRHRSQQPRQPRHRPLRRCRDGRRGLALQARRSPSSARPSPTPSRCPAARPSTSPRCSTRPKRRTSSPASWRTSSATSPIATSWRASSRRPAPVS